MYGGRRIGVFAIDHGGLAMPFNAHRAPTTLDHIEPSDIEPSDIDPKDIELSATERSDLNPMTLGAEMTSSSKGI
jgi:hypothetical protein